MNKKYKEILPHFVVFEGIDGSGTSTQLKRLQEHLEKENINHYTTFEPSSSPIGKLIRSFLAGKEDFTPETVARLYAADRCQHIYGKAGILERTQNKQLVISDRYLFSSLAYQGFTCGKELPSKQNEDFPLPSLLLFFSLPPEIAINRMKNRDFDVYENLEFQKKVKEAYDSVINSFKDSNMEIVIIDATLSPDEIEKIVWTAVSKYWP